MQKRSIRITLYSTFVVHYFCIVSETCTKIRMFYFNIQTISNLKGIIDAQRVTYFLKKNNCLPTLLPTPSIVASLDLLFEFLNVEKRENQLL